MTAATATRTPEAERMDALVAERWHMLTLDTDLNEPEWVATSKASQWTLDLERSLAYALARLCGDGFEGDVDTRAVVDRLYGLISTELMAAAVAFRLGTSDEAKA